MTFSALGTDTQTGQRVDIPKASRLQGLYIIGIQGTGKSGLIENLIMQDIKQQIGVCVLDPHGELIDHVLARLSGQAEEDKVILLDITDFAHPFGLNLFACSDLSNPLEVQKTVDSVMHVFEKLLDVDANTPLIEQYLRNCAYTLVANPGYTMADIPLLLQDAQCRKKLVANVTNTNVQLFWRQHEQKKPNDQSIDIASTLRRIEKFVQPLSNPIVGQSTTTIDLQNIMQDGKILLVKMSAQVEYISNLVGSLIIALMLTAAYNRPAQRRQFHLYADEFQRFATEDFATLLEEARKFAIATTIAHQNRSQLDSANSQLTTNLKDRSRSAGNLIVFKVNGKDANDLAGEFDCTPPPPAMVAHGTQPVLTPRTDAISFLLSGKTHPNNIVNSFLSTWNIQDIEHLVHHGKYSLDISPSINDAFSKASIAFLDMLNTLCYQAMQHNDLSMIAFPLSLFEKMEYFGAELFGANRGQNSSFLYYRQALNEIIQQNQPLTITLASLIPLLTTSLIGEQIDRLFHKKMLIEYLKYIIHNSTNHHIQGPDPQQFPFPQYMQAGWFSLTNLQWVLAKTHQIDPSIAPNYSFKYPYTYKEVNTYQLVRGQEVNWYTQASLDQEIDRLMLSPSGTIQVKQTLVSFLSDLIAMLQVLAVEKIEDHSGLQAASYLPGPQRTFADMQNDIANQLNGLLNYTARVKLGTNAPHNPGKICQGCGAGNGSGVLSCSGCGIKLTAVNEYTLTTNKPAGGISFQQLQQRIARIKAKNLADGYLRDRTTVEAEITQRQTNCSSAAPVQPPQKHTRQVTVPGNCQSCGFANPPGAKFCNQCGGKLP